MNGNEGRNFRILPLDDYTAILNRSLKMIRNSEKENTALKIAVIGTDSVQMIAKVLDAMMIDYGYPAIIYEGEYNGIAMDILDKQSSLYEFSPDIIVLLPSYMNIKQYPSLLDDKESVMNSLQKSVDIFVDYFNRIHTRLPNVHILCSNIVEPVNRPLGNLEGNYLFSRTCFVQLFNLELVMQKPAYVTILDVRSLASRIGLEAWIEPTSYYMAKQGFSLKYIGFFCDLIRRQIQALRGAVKKCLIIDLDNTIWGGEVGDAGYDGIILDPNDPEGEAFRDFQRYIHDLKERGIILAVCSKNDEENAKEPFIHNEFMILTMEDISCFVANWDDKVTNIRRIAQELDMGLDAFVFFDDNPTERTLVRKYLPEVEVIDVPEDPAMFAEALDLKGCFDWIQITREDINRTETYTENRKRESLRLTYGDYRDYLRELHMKGCFHEVDEKSIARFVQLLNKSNQFNLLTHRYSEGQLQFMMDDKRYELYAVSLKDRYSDYGIIACVTLFFDNDECMIHDWCMSCRVLKKGVERYTVGKIIERCMERKVRRIVGIYRPTKKNAMVKHLYPELGFETREDNTQQVYVLEKDEFSLVNADNYIEEIL